MQDRVWLEAGITAISNLHFCFCCACVFDLMLSDFADPGGEGSICLYIW